QEPVSPETAANDSTEESTEVTEPVTPWEDPVPPVLRQSAELRKNNLPNLDKYRPDLIANGKKSYIEKTLATQINRTIMLGAAVGSKTSFTVNVPT
ncbi:hypothetical protein FO504_29325, partial [Bacillus cereus]|uniref:hypothetical protein n=1 Tax=Bacillus cereus TaxID=1396 RepID=UPI00284FE5A9